MKNRKGITLIALIITIIVMLILVAVTISVALNGGVFDNAKNASDKTKRQSEKEELISAMVGAYNSSGNFATSNAVGALPDGVKWCTEADDNYEEVTQNQNTPTNWVITKNNNKFYVDESGSVLDEKPNDKDPIVGSYTGSDTEHGITTTYQYIFLEDETGSAIMTISEEGEDDITNTTSLTWEKSEGKYYLTIGGGTMEVILNADGVLIGDMQCNRDD